MFCAAREWVEPLGGLGLYWKVMLLIGLTNEKFRTFDACGEVALRGSAAGLERGAGGVKRVIAL